REAVIEASQEVDHARRQVLGAMAFLDDLQRPKPRAVASTETYKDAKKGTQSVSLQLSVQDAKLLTFPVDVIPLKLIGFKTVLNTDYKPQQYTASAIGFGGSVEVKSGSESLTIRTDSEHKSGQPGLIGGAEGSVH